MKIFKYISIAFVAVAISACSDSGEKSGDTTDCDSNCTEATHEHNHDGHAHGDECNGHNHGNTIVGIALPGDYKSGKISIKTLDGEQKEFDYTKSNQDKVAAWKAGDTVSIFIDHHHHGEVAHDSITAIKIGAIATKNVDNAHQHNHDNCEGDEHNHSHNH